ncbi:MAG TPA: peptide ABC transporter substrate-binding protein [Rhodobacteraceae bacterium]|nr:peptide ABC transporter substrate-binding protein [Paracoccaceae bacterium]
MNMKSILMGAACAFALAPAAFAERGSDGHVNIIYWQAPSTMNNYLSGGTKEQDAAALVLEPLARYDSGGAMVPWLAESVPTVENGGVSEDLKSITWKLKPGLKWSDGSAVTSADVKFTWEYCTNPDGGCASSNYFEGVETVETPDDLTVVIKFVEPKPFPYGPFVGAATPIIQMAQFKDCVGAKAQECTEQNFHPIGTGPFVVKDFRPNDVISFEANPNYRDPNKPAFASVTFKGGGDAQAAARSVLETGEFDYAWNLQLAPDVLASMEAAGKGTVIKGFGTSVERIMINLTDVSPDLGDERGTVKHPHPFLSDINVRKALSMAIDRALLTKIGYGETGKPTCNVLPAPDIYVSTANDDCLVQDIDGANKLLDEAGWAKGSDGIRAKDGVRLSVLYQTSTNAVRQKYQAAIKQWWNQIGVEVELRNISASVFFGSDPGSNDTFQKFFADVEMYTNNFNGTDPESYMASWTCAQIPSPENQWQGNNMPRFCNEDYEALVKEMSVTGDINKRAELAKAMNDMLMQNYIMLPITHRSSVSARSNTLNGVEMNVWDSEMWNIADWSRAK